jgi:hypothetical protein
MSTNEASRAEFERWANDDLDLDTFSESDEYADPDTEHAWTVWQAAVAAQAPSVAVGELEALADMWEGYCRNRDNDYETGVEHGKNRCADDLRNLIKANSNE